MKRYPKSPVVTQFLGSDINELVFAFARIGMFAGRRTNLDCLRLAQALEKRNTYSALSKDDEDNGTAHSRAVECSIMLPMKRRLELFIQEVTFLCRT